MEGSYPCRVRDYSCFHYNRIAAHDGGLQGARVERILRLLWKMAMHPLAPPEVQLELPSVLTNFAYTDLGKATMSEYIAKCSEQLVQGENIVVVVSMLTSLVDAVGSTALESV